MGLPAHMQFEKPSRQWDLNPRPAVYETAALPLSYVGAIPKFSRPGRNWSKQWLGGVYIGMERA